MKRSSKGSTSILDSNRPLVLIVDDNPITVHILGMALQQVGVQFLAVRNGLKAIAAAKMRSFNLILMDIMMPMMDGMQATRAIRELSPRCASMPIIAVTSRFDAETLAEYSAAGLTNSIDKPVNFRAFFHTISQYMVLDRALVSATMQRIEEDVSFGHSARESDALNWEIMHQYKAILREEFLPLLDNFLRDSPLEVYDLGEAIEARDPKATQFIAHRFKSSCMVFGAQKLSQYAEDVEYQGKRESFTKIDSTFETLKESFILSRHELEKHSASLHFGAAQ
ncbi:MAG: response regulator [Kordiimonadaceae bacterium]|nr:response regulator [Kordiimonadaceae bacterium]